MIRPRATPGIVIINAGTSLRSSTKRLGHLLADDISARTGLEVTSIDLGALAVDIAHAIVSGERNATLDHAQDLLRYAAAVVVGTPVYKAGISGLLKSFVDVLEPDTLVGTPTALTATGGSIRHALVVDNQLRSLFAYMHAFSAPTGIFVAPDDWNDPDLPSRIARLSAEVTALVSVAASDEREQAPIALAG